VGGETDRDHDGICIKIHGDDASDDGLHEEIDGFDGLSSQNDERSCDATGCGPITSADRSSGKLEETVRHANSDRDSECQNLLPVD
jgi:hypothetical protein